MDQANDPDGKLYVAGKNTAQNFQSPQLWQVNGPPVLRKHLCSQNLSEHRADVAKTPKVQKAPTEFPAATLFVRDADRA